MWLGSIVSLLGSEVIFVKDDIKFKKDVKKLYKLEKYADNPLLYAWIAPLDGVANKLTIEEEYEIITNSICDERLQTFARVLIRNFDNTKLANFFSNLNTFRIIYRGGSKLQKKDAGGFCLYNAKRPDFNITISIPRYLNTPFNKTVPWHEFFHFASMKYDPIKKSSTWGFNYVNSIGIGLNEGYTDVLTKRYFEGSSYNVPIEMDTL